MATPGSSLIFPDSVARPFTPFQHQAHRVRKSSASLSRSSPPPAVKKTTAAITDEPCTGNAIALTDILEHAPSVAARISLLLPSIWRKPGGATAPSASPQGPLQKPSGNLKNDAPRREIDFVFLNSGRRSTSPIPAVPSEDWEELLPSACRFCHCRADSGVAVAIQASPAHGRPRVRLQELHSLTCMHTFGTNQAIAPFGLSPRRRPSLTSSPSLIPAISGDKKTTFRCGTMLRIFSPLAASSNSPPLVAGADGKLAGELGYYCYCCCFLLSPVHMTDCEFVDGEGVELVVIFILRISTSENLLQVVECYGNRCFLRTGPF